MTVPRDSSGNAICGSSQEFTVQNIRFYSYTTNAFLDAQLFEDSSTYAPQGEIKVRIELSPGLYFDTTNVHLPYMHSALLNYTWLPLTNSFHSIVPPAGSGTAYEGIYVFDTTNFQTFSKLRDMMNFSDFHYWLYPCCADGGGAASMNVKFFFNPQPDTVCANCYIPLSSTKDTIDIRCPNCQTPGVETISLKLVREPFSYGMPDSDNDGLADATLSQITPADTAALALIRLNASFSGDHLISVMRGVFHNGAITPAHNLTYGNYLNYHTPFKYLYMEQNISHSGTTEFNLIPDSATLTVYSSSTFVHNVNLTTELSRNGNMYFFKFVPDSIDTAYTIQVNDQFELKIHFRECGNKIPASQAAADNAFDADPLGAMYFTDSLLDSAVYFTHTGAYTADEGYALLCNAGDSLDTCHYSAQSLNPDWLYFCGAYSCIHRFYSIRVTNSSGWANVLSQDNYSPCHKRMNMLMKANIGGDAENVFPFEYRAPMTEFTVNQFMATIPAGFLSNGASLVSTFHTYLPGCSSYNSVTVTENTTYAPISGTHTFAFPFLEQANENFSLPSSLPCFKDSTVAFGSTQYIGDEYSELAYSVNLYPVCDSQQCHIAVDTILANLSVFGCAASDTAFLPSTGSAAYSDFTMPYYNSSDANCLDSQLIALSPPGTIPVSSQQIQFQFTIRNTTVDTSTCLGCVFVAPNVWVYIPNNSFLQNMHISCSSLNCHALNNVPPDANNFFGLGNISPGNASGYQSCTYTITADYTGCLGAGIHAIPIYYGWYCGAYPAVLGTYQYPTSLANDVCSLNLHQRKTRKLLTQFSLPQSRKAGTNLQQTKSVSCKW